MSQYSMNDSKLGETKRLQLIIRREESKYERQHSDISPMLGEQRKNDVRKASEQQEDDLPSQRFKREKDNEVNRNAFKQAKKLESSMPSAEAAEEVRDLNWESLNARINEAMGVGNINQRITTPVEVLDNTFGRQQER